MPNKRGRKPLKFPKTHVVTFRLSELEYHALRFYTQHVAQYNESFSDTISRVLRDVIVNAAAKQLEFIRNTTNPTVSITRDACRREILKAGAVVKRSIADGKPQPDEYPTLTDEALNSAFKVAASLASPSVAAASLALRGGTHDNTGDGE